MRDPRVVLQFDRGRAWTELAGGLVHGRAESLVPEQPEARRPLSAWFEKYRGALGGDGFTRYAEDVPRPGLLRVHPDRVITWVHASKGSDRPRAGEVPEDR